MDGRITYRRYAAECLAFSQEGSRSNRAALFLEKSFSWREIAIMSAKSSVKEPLQQALGTRAEFNPASKGVQREHL